MGFKNAGEFKNDASIDLGKVLATDGLGSDLRGYRGGFLDMVDAYDKIEKIK